ncbi:MAG: phosphoribosylamine--glycine ligase [Elusimicrobia bacterium]|nr:phosphoribosylamine--glycine ligase [Elusimicrobiota bacterium]
MTERSARARGRLRVLLLGAGGREHALAWKLRRSASLEKLFSAPGSEAISEHAERVALDSLDPSAVTAFCGREKVGLVVVGPEAPLEAGVADALRAAGVPVFGPGKAAARLETSKAFAKDFMTRHGVPTARHQTFSSAAEARDALRSWASGVVVKADGLAQGKGVAVCADRAEALKAVSEFMEGGRLGKAGARIILEERLSGPELSVMALVSSGSMSLLPFSRDHKRLADDDEGPNTGGMGAVAPVPVGPEALRRIESEVMARVLAGLKADGLDYRGALYAGLMLTKDGPKALEFNCRFGDPEAQAVLPLLEGDFLETLLDCSLGRPLAGPVKTSGGACACVVLASEGYPEAPRTGRPISGLEAPLEEGVRVFHAGTSRGERGWVTKGGRVLGVTATAASLEEARNKAYAGVSRISFEGMRYRKDIGAATLEPARKARRAS